MVSNISNTATELVEVSYPSRTYRLDTVAGRINGFVDEQNAVKQFVQKALATERYAYVIYSDDYGTEIESLIGQDPDFVISALKSNIQDSLLSDDRILSITNFTFDKTDFESLTISFAVNSIYGQIQIEPTSLG